jgi:hypothetical protein
MSTQHATERAFDALPDLSEVDRERERQIREALVFMCAARTDWARRRYWERAKCLIDARSPAAVWAIESHLGLTA